MRALNDVRWVRPELAERTVVVMDSQQYQEDISPRLFGTVSLRHMGSVRLRLRRVVVGLLALAVAAVGFVGLSISPAWAGEQSLSTVGAHTFTVPAGVTSITVTATGGGGGSGPGGDGGGGCTVTGATLSVAPATQLAVFVGGGGGAYSGGGSSSVNAGDSGNQVIAGGGGGASGDTGGSGCALGDGSGGEGSGTGSNRGDGGSLGIGGNGGGSATNGGDGDGGNGGDGGLGSGGGSGGAGSGIGGSGDAAGGGGGYGGGGGGTSGGGAGGSIGSGDNTTYSTATNGAPSSNSGTPGGDGAVTITWTSFAVTYDGNSNTGGTVPVDSATYAAGVTVPVAGNTGSLTKTGYTFAGWFNATSGGTEYGSTFTMPSSAVTLYAQWTATGTDSEQTPVNACVTKGSRTSIPRSGSKRLMKPDCVTNAAQPGGVRVNSATPRGDLTYYTLSCSYTNNGKKINKATRSAGYGGRYRTCARGKMMIRTYGTPINLSITWYAPKTGTYPAYKTTKKYRT